MKSGSASHRGSSTVDILFRASLILKGLDALLEALGGILLLMPFELDRTISFLLQHELYAEVRHPTTAHIEHAAAVALQNATLVGAIYLIIHGLAKVILIAAVFKEKKWGFVGLVGVLSVFALVELFRFATTHSVLVLALALFDAFIVYLIAKEYRIRYPGRPRATG